MRSLARDLGGAFRSLCWRPGYVAVAVCTLALAIGATTAVFSVVDALMLRPGPYRNAHELFELTAQPAEPLSNVTVRMGFGAESLRAIGERADLLSQIETYAQTSRTVTGANEPAVVGLMQVSGGLLQMLGVEPQLGRLLTPEDFAGANGPVLLISDRLWREQFGSAASAVGRALDLDGTAHTVVGVMPRRFAFPREATRGWIPAPAPSPRAGLRNADVVLIRLQRGVTFERAATELRALGEPLQQAGLLPKGLVPVLQRRMSINPSERAPLLILLGAVALVLAVACVNVMSLSLAQGTGRQRELAVRTALGASRARLMRQLLAENLMLALFGGAGGAALAHIAVTNLAPLIPTTLTWLSVNAVRVDGRVLIFALAVTLVSGLLAGVFPAVRASRTDVIEALKATSRGQGASVSARRLLWATSAAQCALAVILLAGAALLIRSFLVLQAVDPGFDPRNLVVLQSQLPRYRYPDGTSQMAFNQRMVQELLGVPGVTGVTVSGGAPPSGGAISFGYFENNTGVLITRDFEIPHMPISPDYFQVMRIPLLAGRGFMTNEPAHSVIINDLFAARYWGSIQGALDGRFRLSAKDPWYSVIGVSADVKTMGLDDRREGGLEFYYPWSGRAWGAYFYSVRTAVPDAQVIPLLRERFWSADPRVPLLRSSDSRSFLMTSVARPRFFSVLLALFAAIGAVVAAVGIYGMFSYLVAQRRHEVGVRMALGATGGQMLRLVLREAAILAVSGVVFGLAGAWALSRTLQTLLFQITPTDPIALSAAATCLALVAMAACYLPARRAQRVDPLSMLKVD